MLWWYSSCFKHLIAWCYRTAIAQFVIFLFLFLGVSYLSTLLEISYNTDGTAKFTSEYEKYIVLASSLYMIVPFAFSNLLLFGLLHKNSVVLKVFMIGSVVNSVIILIVVLGSGIFLAIKGTAYIAYSLIGFAIVLELGLVHGILLVYGARKKYLQKNDGSGTRENSDNIEET